MAKKSEVKREIIRHLRANGGTSTNANDLICGQLKRAWCHGYRTLTDMEREGLVTIQRNGRGRPMVITLAKANGQ
jgi:uncharacterized membrane protein